MFVKSYLALGAAAAVSSVSAFNLPDFGQFAVDSGLALTGLNSIALVNSLANLKGSCTLSNLKFRQEWYVVLTPFLHPLASSSSISAENRSEVAC